MRPTLHPSKPSPVSALPPLPRKYRKPVETITIPPPIPIKNRRLIVSTGMKLDTWSERNKYRWNLAAPPPLPKKTWRLLTKKIWTLERLVYFGMLIV